MFSLRIHDWDEHQTYRKDRGQPPWIKVHRELMRKPKWVRLSDAQRGQLLSLWILAADNDGYLPDDPSLLRKLCYMDSEPDLEVFVSLGFIDRDDSATPPRRHDDAEVTAQSALARGRGREEAEAEAELTHRAREAESDELSEWLNDYSDSLPTGPPLDDPQVRRTIYQHYGPPSMRASAWKTDTGESVPGDERPRILAVALGGYLSVEGKRRIVPSEFDGMLRATARAELGTASGSDWSDAPL